MINKVLNPYTCIYMQVVSKLEKQEREPWPVEKVAHAACCFSFGTKNPHLLVTGGLDNEGKTLKDVWLFDVTNRRWKEVGQVKYIYSQQLC